MRQGLELFLNATKPPKKWYQNLICSMFHTNYDDQIHETLLQSRKSTQALCATFENYEINIGVQHTIDIILKNNKDYHYFLDIMWSAFKQQDHQTAHMLLLVLTHKTLNHIKKPKRAQKQFHEMKYFYGPPTYKKHIRFWRSVRTDNILPSLIAFKTFIKRRTFMQRNQEVQEANDFIEIFKYLEYDLKDILHIYHKNLHINHNKHYHN